MRLWMFARRAHIYMPGSLALFGFLAWTLREEYAELPSFLMGGGGSVPLLCIAPIPACAALAMMLDSRMESAEASGVRPIVALDLGLIALTVALAASIGVLFHSLDHSDTSLAAGRNTAFLVGLMLVARAFTKEGAAMVPAAWVLLVAVVGYGDGHRPRVWAVIARDGQDPFAFAISVMTFAVAILFMSAGRYRKL
ncbi:hypothetical protein DMB38_19385 [Streptomyces sp. WAC 06738]|uniref:hypothetical protein n=1 Tax=Streptomyces sp. WAC 06738 TaxID=2203210 RepID=UPI000F6E1B9B|nr:hypothetical protein [Streptomyces sp. WAC 06738]AZM47662.1 hypothetical protein DMB38_19385 [Streptomyces sp. WAC 06738]